MIGCEYANIFAALGVRVTLIDKRDRLLPFVDHEIADALCHHLRENRATLRLNESVNSLETIERIAVLHLAEGSAELPFAELDEGFRQRSTYQEGSLTDPPDLSIYQDPADQNHE